MESQYILGSMSFSIRRFLESQDLRREEGTISSAWSYQLLIPESLPFFQGHFPGHPVLPAAFVIEFSWHLSFWPQNPPLQELRHLVRGKFMKPILPQESYEVSFERRQKGAQDFCWVNWSDVQGDLRVTLQFLSPLCKRGKEVNP